MALAQVTLVGTFLEPDSGPADGEVEFQLDVPDPVPAEDRILASVPVRTELDGSGAFSVVLYACDQGLVEGNTYRVTVRLNGADPYSYKILVPSSANNTTVDLSDFVPVNPKPYYDLIGPEGPAGPAGPVGPQGPAGPAGEGGSGGGGVNLDGGGPSTNYGGTEPLDGGGVA